MHARNKCISIGSGGPYPLGFKTQNFAYQIKRPRDLVYPGPRPILLGRCYTRSGFPRACLCASSFPRLGSRCRKCRRLFVLRHLDFFCSCYEPLQKKGIHLQWRLVGHIRLLILLLYVTHGGFQLGLKARRDGVEEFAHDGTWDCIRVLEQTAIHIEHFWVCNGIRRLCDHLDRSWKRVRRCKLSEDKGDILLTFQKGCYVL